MAPTIPVVVRPGNPKLLDRVRDVIRRKHYSFRTEQTYIDWIRRFILFHRKRHPSEMAEAEVTEFLTSLAREGNVAAPHEEDVEAGLGSVYMRRPSKGNTPARSGNRTNNTSFPRLGSEVVEYRRGVVLLSRPPARREISGGGNLGPGSR